MTEKPIDIKELQDFVSEHPGVLFARGKNKQLIVAVGRQIYKVYQKINDVWVLIYADMQPDPALELYNNL